MKKEKQKKLYTESSKVLIENEREANVALSKGCMFMAGFIALFWLLNLIGILPVNSLLSLNIVLPIEIALLITPIFYIKTKRIEHYGFKYFILSLYVFVVFVLNVILPKHGILGWAVIIVVACHYYDKKISLFAYIIVSLMLLFALYLSMILGEWDANVMGATIDNDQILIGFEGFDTSSISGRIDWIKYINANSKPIPQLLKVALYYYFGRELFLTLIYIIAHQLSTRTHLLLQKDATYASEKEKINSELMIASEIQSGLLPKEFPKDSRLDLFAGMVPAKEIGGDLYDFFTPSENTLFFDVGDVSGKGVPASLFMMHTKTLLKTIGKADIGLDKVLEYANSELCSGNEKGMFVTAVLGRLDLSSGTLKLANAGHNPILIRKNGVYDYLKLPKGFILGGLEGCKYKEYQTELAPGDQIFIYTDGVTEAADKDGKQFGEARLKDCLNAAEDKSTLGSCRAVRDAVKGFVGNTEQFDDITIFCITYKGDAETSK